MLAPSCVAKRRCTEKAGIALIKKPHELWCVRLMLNTVWQILPCPHDKEATTCCCDWQDCQPLWLKAQDGSAFKFVGAAELVKGTVAPDMALVPPDTVGNSEVQPLTPAQLANQVQLRAREFVSQYYDSWLKSDDELLPVETRSVSLRTQPDAKPGTATPAASQQGRMARAYSEADLYTQLAHFARLLDADRAVQQFDEGQDRQAALDRAVAVRATLAPGLQAIKLLQDANAYRWISLHSLYSVEAKAG